MSKIPFKLEPLELLNLDNINSFDDMLCAMSKTAFQGRNLGEAADVLYEMIEDVDCKIILTLSGAMTIAKMQLVICEMIDRGMVDAIVSTGALMAHGFAESLDCQHFKVPKGVTDEELQGHRLDRVYDTLETEDNLDKASEVVDTILYEMASNLHSFASYDFTRALGDHLLKRKSGRNVFSSASQANVPIFVPAFMDSELGLDFSLWSRRYYRTGYSAPPMHFDPLNDWNKYADQVVGKAERLGIFTIGGGVPRNWAQQVGPYYDLLHARNGEKHRSVKFSYGVRICPEPMHWGGLSGCTYSEGVSWGKFDPQGSFAEVMADATIAWPILIKAVIERWENAH
jgi:deoxyhypusine synthase